MGFQWGFLTLLATVCHSSQLPLTAVGADRAAWVRLGSPSPRWGSTLRNRRELEPKGLKGKVLPAEFLTRSRSPLRFAQEAPAAAALPVSNPTGRGLDDAPEPWAE